MGSFVPSDRTILDLLREHGRMTVLDFERELGVTATAVRQRLNRLLDRGLLQRQKDPDAAGRGRPSHWYELTREGVRRTGANFADLALVLWDELRSITDDSVRRGLLSRLATRLAAQYRAEVSATSVPGRLEQLVALFADRQLPFRVRPSGDDGLPVLTALACPYTDLAEQDRAVCAMERLLFSQLVGRRMTLTDCRLDGHACCTFQVHTESADGLPFEDLPAVGTG